MVADGIQRILKEKPYLFFLALLVIGTILRLYNLAEESVWVDEAFTYHYVTLSWADLLNVLKNDVHPFLFYALTKIVVFFFGFSETVLRALPFLFGSLSIPLLFLLTKKLYDFRTALLSTFFFTLSYTFILYSQEAKMYAQLVFFILASVYTFILFLEEPKTKQLVWYAISTALMLHTHILSFIILFLEILTYFTTFYLFKKQKIFLLERLFNLNIIYDFKQFISAFLVILLFYLPWFPYFYFQFKRLFLDMLPLKFAEKFGFNGFYPLAILFLVIGILAIYWIFWILSDHKRTLKVQHFLKKIHKSSALLIILFISWLIINFIFRKHFFGTLFYIRYTLFLYPFVYIYLARRLLNFRAVWFYALMFLYLISTSFILYDYYQVDGKEQWREAAQFIEQEAKVNDILIFHTGGHTWWSFSYYYHGNQTQLRLNKESEFEKIPPALVGKQHAFLILSHNYQTKDFFPKQMEQHYSSEQTYPLIGIIIYKYKI